MCQSAFDWQSAYLSIHHYPSSIYPALKHIETLLTPFASESFALNASWGFTPSRAGSGTRGACFWDLAICCSSHGFEDWWFEHQKSSSHKNGTWGFKVIHIWRSSSILDTGGEITWNSHLKPILSYIRLWKVCVSANLSRYFSSSKPCDALERTECGVWAVRRTCRQKFSEKRRRWAQDGCQWSNEIDYIPPVVKHGNWKSFIYIYISIYRFIDDFPIETCICSVFSIATITRECLFHPPSPLCLE